MVLESCLRWNACRRGGKNGLRFSVAPLSLLQATSSLIHSSTYGLPGSSLIRTRNRVPYGVRFWRHQLLTPNIVAYPFRKRQVLAENQSNYIHHESATYQVRISREETHHGIPSSYVRISLNPSATILAYAQTDCG